MNKWLNASIAGTLVASLLIVGSGAGILISNNKVDEPGINPPGPIYPEISNPKLDFDGIYWKNEAKEVVETIIEKIWEIEDKIQEIEDKFYAFLISNPQADFDGLVIKGAFDQKVEIVKFRLEMLSMTLEQLIADGKTSIEEIKDFIKEQAEIIVAKIQEIANDIRNTLEIIVERAEEILDTIRGAIPGIRERIEEIKEAAEEALETIKEILEILEGILPSQELNVSMNTKITGHTWEQKFWFHPENGGASRHVELSESGDYFDRIHMAHLKARNDDLQDHALGNLGSEKYLNNTFELETKVVVRDQSCSDLGRATINLNFNTGNSWTLSQSHIHGTQVENDCEFFFDYSSTKIHMHHIVNDNFFMVQWKPQYWQSNDGLKLWRDDFDQKFVEMNTFRLMTDGEEAVFFNPQHNENTFYIYHLTFEGREGEYFYESGGMVGLDYYFRPLIDGGSQNLYIDPNDFWDEEEFCTIYKDFFLNYDLTNNCNYD